MAKATGAQRVWLDCDPGHDDAFAIWLAVHDPRICLLGISTVFGNQSVDKTTINALRCLQVAGAAADVRVAAGAAGPLLGSASTCPEIHGESGLDGVSWPALRRSAVAGPAIVEMHRVISAQPAGSVDIVATGCMTNVALFFAVYPRMLQHVRQVVLLGGSIGIGNMTAAAEFNILIDPEAASMVFNSGIRVVQVPLEVSHTALATDAVLDELRQFKTPFGQMLVDLLLFFQKSYQDMFDFPHPPLHDPCAMLYVADPSLFKLKHCHVHVETASAVARGATYCDLYGMSDKPANVHVATSMDVPAFWRALVAALKQANSSADLS